MKRSPLVLVVAIWTVTFLIQGCANSPPLIAPALLAQKPGPSSTGVVSFNVLSNYGRTEFEDTVEVESDYGHRTRPTYENSEMNSGGQIWLNEYGFLAWYIPNMQLQVYGGLRWGSHAAVGYFPTFSFFGKQMLHGIQLDLNGFDRFFLTASLYEENFTSIFHSTLSGEGQVVKTYAVSSLALSIPYHAGPSVIWVIPNWRTALSNRTLTRFGVNFAWSWAFSKAR